MSRSLVVVLYEHSLFGHGIGTLLRSDDQLKIACLPLCEGNIRTRLKRLRPGIVILEAPHDGVIWQMLTDLPPVTVIRVSLDEDVMDVYYGHRVVIARPDNLLDAVHTGLDGHAA
jgi:hypothetical protein